VKLRHYLAVALVTLILHGVTLASCYDHCNPLKPITCEP
jgi:hypothetical protein